MERAEVNYPGNDGARIQSFGIKEHSVNLILRLGFESSSVWFPSGPTAWSTVRQESQTQNFLEIWHANERHKWSVDTFCCF